MNFNLTKKTRLILVSALALALLGGVFYGGYRYWRSRQPAPPTAIQEYTYYDVLGGRIACPPDWHIVRHSNDLTYFAVPHEGDDWDNPDEWERLLWVYTSFFPYVCTDEGSSCEEFKQAKFKEELGGLGHFDIPDAPNTQVSGIPAYSYKFTKEDSGEEFWAVSFRHNRTFSIYFPWEKRDDPVYEKVIGSFEFVD